MGTENKKHEPETGGNTFTRRQVLGGAATAGLTALGAAYFSQDREDNQNPGAAPDQDQTTTHKQNNTTKEKGLLEQTHSAENLDGVVQKLEQDSVPLNFVPADENAEYRNSNIFDQYSTNNPNALTVELDLQKAIDQRHFIDPNKRWSEESVNTIQEFVQGVKNEDDEWVDSLYNKYLEMAGGEDLLGLKEGIQNLSWNTYKDQSLSFDQRITESGIHDLWYLNEMVNYGANSSTNNQYKAHALQGTEQNAGFNTFIWEFRIPSHGLIPAIENPTRSEDEIGQQEAYVIETDQGQDQQIATMENSQYQDDPPFNGNNKRNKKEGLYEYTATENAENLAPKINPSLEVQNKLVEYFHKPQSEPAYDHLDPMNTAAYIAEQNILKGELEAEIELGTDSIVIQAD